MYRIGQGFDVHRFSEMPPEAGIIMLGGVPVPSVLSLLAHSDGDVVLHALCDALLGAAGMGDIGQHFSDQDNAFHNMNSDWFITQTMSWLHEKAFAVVNVDLTIIAETPKINPHRQAISQRISELLQIDHGFVNVKATTTEKLGFTGRGEGIAAQVVVLLQQSA